MRSVTLLAAVLAFLGFGAARPAQPIPSFEHVIVVVFENKEAYRANADSPEQDARYQKLRALLEDDPEWNDGEIVYSEGSPSS